MDKKDNIVSARMALKSVISLLKVSLCLLLLHIVCDYCEPQCNGLQWVAHHFCLLEGDGGGDCP